MAAVRLRRVKEEYGDKVIIGVKSFPLYPGHAPQRLINPHSIEGRRRASEAEEDAKITPWDESLYYPSSSMPALEAAKCAALQGEEAFERYDLAIFEAFFHKSKDISQRDTLLELAETADLDMTKFTADLDEGGQREKVLADFEEAKSSFGHMVTGVPFVTLEDKYPLVGAMPTEVYRHVVESVLNPS